MFTDRLFAGPAELSAKMQAKATESPVYFYLFNYNDGEIKMVNYYSRSQEIKGRGDSVIILNRSGFRA